MSKNYINYKKVFTQNNIKNILLNLSEQALIDIYIECCRIYKYQFNNLNEYFEPIYKMSDFNKLLRKEDASDIIKLVQNDFEYEDNVYFHLNPRGLYQSFNYLCETYHPLFCNSTETIEKMTQYLVSLSKYYKHNLCKTYPTIFKEKIKL